MARRPLITLKLATSLDGKIALANGQSEWITGEGARAAGRKLRAEHDAICVGANTAHLDNPQLTARIDGAPDPLRVIFDSGAQLSARSNLAQSAQSTPVILFCEAGRERAELTQLGVTQIALPRTPRGLDIALALDVLTRNAVDSLLIEGGGKLAASFVALGVIDRIEWFRAPLILGADGRDAIGTLGLTDMGQAFRYRRAAVQEIGDDLRETYERMK